MEAEDVMELVVANPSANHSYDSLQRAFQLVFTKISPNETNGHSLQDACDRVLQFVDTNDRAIRFVLKQLMDASRRNDQQAARLAKAMESVLEEREQLQQAIITEKMNNELTIKNLQREIQALEVLDHDQQNGIRELDIQLRQLYELTATDSLSDARSEGSRGSQGSTSVSPMYGFAIQEQHSRRSPGPPTAATTRSPYQEDTQRPDDFVVSAVQLRSPGPKMSTTAHSPYQEYPRSPHGSGHAVQQHGSRPHSPYPARGRSSSAHRSPGPTLATTARSPYQEYPRSPYRSGNAVQQYGSRPNSLGCSSPGPGYEILIRDDAQGDGRPNTPNYHYNHS